MRIENRNGEGNMAFEVRGIDGDMGEGVTMDLLQQADGDVIVVLSEKGGHRLAIEFCSVIGGGRQPGIAKKLRELVALLVEEEASVQDRRSRP